MQSHIKIFYFLLILIKYVTSDMIPVLIFGKALPTKVPALTGLSSQKFLQMLQSEIRSDKTVIVAFMTPTFDIEDVSQCKDKCFDKIPYTFSYVPNVEDPEIVLKKGLQAEVGTIEGLIDDIKEGKRRLIINLDGNHDHSRIFSLNKWLQDRFSDVIIIYSGYRRTSKTRRNKRSIDHLPLESKYITLAAEAFIERNGNSSEIVSEIQSIATQVDGYTLYANFFPMNFTLKFIKQGNAWSLTSAQRNTLVYTIPKYVGAMETYSYRCPSNLTFIHRDSVIKIFNTQILVSFLREHPKFDLTKIVYCDGFVTAGILSGLLISTFLLSILMCGLMSIFNIRTNDRYDDHHTKAIVVNVNE